MNYQLQAIVRWQRTAQQIIVLALILMVLNAFAISKQTEAQDEVKLYESQVQTNSQNLQLIEPMYVKE